MKLFRHPHATLFTVLGVLALALVFVYIIKLPLLLNDDIGTEHHHEDGHSEESEHADEHEEEADVMHVETDIHEEAEVHIEGHDEEAGHHED